MIKATKALSDRVVSLAMRMGVKEADAHLVKVSMVTREGGAALGSFVAGGIPPELELPHFVVCQKLQDLNQTKVTILGQRQVFGGHASNNSSVPFARTLLWSEAHLDFLVSHELAHLYHADNHFREKNTGVGGFFGGFMGGDAAVATRPPPPAIGDGYTAISELGLSDNHNIELRADERAASVSAQVALGGLELMHKKLAFGRILRAATLADSRFAVKNEIDETGDQTSESHPTLALRLGRLEDILRAQHGLEVEVRGLDEIPTQVTDPLASVVVKRTSETTTNEDTQTLDKLVRDMTSTHSFQYTYMVDGHESTPISPTRSEPTGGGGRHGKNSKQRKKGKRGRK